MKRITALFFGLLLLATTAAGQSPYAYFVENGGITINGYGGMPPTGNLIIPPTLDNLPVTGIADGSFSGASSITNVVIPASVNNINSGAFAGCAGLMAIEVDPLNPAYATSNGVLFTKTLTTLVEFPGGMDGSYTIPDGVTNIGADAFQQCFNLTNIIIAESVKTMGDLAFEDCTGLFAVTIPPSVSSIGIEPFSGCTGLTAINVAAHNSSYGSTNGALFNKKLTILIEIPGGIAGSYTVPRGVKTIEGSAFENCSALTDIIIPTTVTTIGAGAFFGCTELTNIEVSGPSLFFSSANGVLYNANQTMLLDYPPGAAGILTVPTTVTNISEDAFQNCLGLTGVQLPESLSSIGRDAFYNCLNLKSVEIPGSVGDIGAEAFKYCTRMTDVAIDDGVGNIESNAFENCYSLVNASIPGSVTNIGQFAFEYCLSLPTISIPAGITAIGDQAFKYCSGLTNLSIADTVTKIGFESFAYCSGLMSLMLPNSLTNPGSYAFYECASLTQVRIPSNVTSIGVGMFDQCYDLANITIGAGVATIGNFAFNQCTSLAQISIPASVTSIGTAPFSGCSSLVSINVDAQNQRYSSLNGILLNKNQTTIIEAPGGLSGTYAIPTGITQLGNYAFVNCSALTNVIIPDTMTSIGALAFENCTGLTALNFPMSVISLGADAFYKSGVTSFYFSGNAPTVDPTAFVSTANPMVYYLPGSSGWAAFSVRTGVLATLWNPVIQVSDGGFGINNNQFGFNITAPTNLIVVVEACSNLADPVWTPITTVALTNGSFHFTEPVQTNNPTRFYGLAWP